MTNTTESGSSNAPETMKKEGDYMSLSELEIALGQYGNVEIVHGHDQDGNSNDAHVLYVTPSQGTLIGERYAVIIPAKKWRRETTKDATDTVVGVGPQTTDERFQVSEMSVLMLNVEESDEVSDLEKELADRTIRYNLDPKTKTIGAELEFNFSPNTSEGFLELAKETLVENMIELILCQREYGFDPVSDTQELKALLKSELRAIVSSLEEKGLYLNLSGTSADLHLGQEGNRSLIVGDPSPYAVYVNFLSGELAKVMSDNLHLVPQDTKDNWTSIATTNGFDDIEDMLGKVENLSHWLMNAGHVSINLEGSERTGRVSPTVVRNTDNLLIYYRSLLNGLTYSGNHTFNQEVTINGQPVADAREVLRSIMLTSLPADPIRPGKKLAEHVIELMLRGDSNHPDRAGLTTVLENGVELPNTHGDIRNRISLPYNLFSQLLSSGKAGSEIPTIYSVTKDDVTSIKSVTERLRIEYTSRSANPDMSRYLWSVDIQEILYKAANLAAKDGYKDVYLWLQEKVGIDIDPESEYETTLAQRMSEQRDALLGKFPKHKLESMKTLVKYVDDRLLEEYESRHLSARGALKGINALENLEYFVETSRDLSARDKVILFFDHGIANIGTLENVLSDDDIRDILVIDTEKMFTRGQLLTRLRDEIAKSQLNLRNSE